ncbi:hypothetical protein B296_00028657 [Ensete ventricosum]|uniref:Uncharacterized protein n=1 Tax=Ensete ventricosum TaxID=4639 RepID=A0A427AMD1_ENSVE|nr:hypothetical protein B296_00028657 [Ensete ventricosum]
MLGADREPVASMDLQLRGQPHVHLTNWHCLGVHIVAVVAFLFLVEANLGHHIPEMADMVAAVRKPRGAVRFLSGDNNSQNHDLAGNAEGWMDPNHVLNHGPVGVKQKPFQADAGEKLAHFHHWPHPKLNYPHQQEVQFCDSVPCCQLHKNVKAGGTRTAPDEISQAMSRGTWLDPVFKATSGIELHGMVSVTARRQPRFSFPLAFPCGSIGGPEDFNDRDWPTLQLAGRVHYL